MPRKQKIIIPKWAVAVLLILLIISALGLSWGFYSYKVVSDAVSKQKYDFGSLNQLKTKQEQRSGEVVENVGKLILLPDNEKPIIATIIDVEKIKKDQSFYANAKNGDIVLVYQVAKKAFIYDPVKSIIVNVGPVFVEKNVVSISATSTTLTP
ncbi:MAG: hypothetical protein AAB348_01385 [Patescibacteria group bacterium]